MPGLLQEIDNLGTCPQNLLGLRAIPANLAPGF
jgi:hypothetical protein